MPAKNVHGFAVQVEDEFGVRQLAAIAFYIDPDDGDLCRPRWDIYREASYSIRHLADFTVRAFLTPSTAAVPYGIRHCYTPHELELGQAETIVKTLRRLRRGLDAIERNEGHLPQGDYAGYLIRIGRVPTSRHLPRPQQSDRARDHRPILATNRRRRPPDLGHRTRSRRHHDILTTTLKPSACPWAPGSGGRR